LQLLVQRERQVRTVHLHTSAYASVRQHTPAYVGIQTAGSDSTPAYVSLRQLTSAYASIRQHTPAYASIRQHTSAYVSIRQHTSAHASIPGAAHWQGRQWRQREAGCLDPTDETRPSRSPASLLSCSAYSSSCVSVCTFVPVKQVNRVPSDSRSASR
jgi:hypothetical protein